MQLTTKSRHPAAITRPTGRTYIGHDMHGDNAWRYGLCASEELTQCGSHPRSCLCFVGGRVSYFKLWSSTDEGVPRYKRHLYSGVSVVDCVATRMAGMGRLYCCVVCGGFLVSQRHAPIVVALDAIDRCADRYRSRRPAYPGTNLACPNDNQPPLTIKSGRITRFT